MSNYMTSNWSWSSAGEYSGHSIPPGASSSSLGVAMDQYIQQDLTQLRNSQANWMSENCEALSEDMMVDVFNDNDIKFFVVLDTNVLLSYLPLIRSLVDDIARQTELPAALMIPSVVVSELNYLKERNLNPSTRAKAQEANVWLLNETRTGRGLVRGQKDDGVRRDRNSGRVNDDLIIDYCQELLNLALACGGKVSLLSNDQNCCLKCEIAGISTISLSPSSRSQAILQNILPSTYSLDNSSAASRWAPTTASLGRTQSAPPTISKHSAHKTIKSHSNYNTTNMTMDLDPEPDIEPIPTIIDPFDHLHQGLIQYLTPILAQAAYLAAEQEQKQCGKDQVQSKTTKPSFVGGSQASIHAPKISNGTRTSPLRKSKSLPFTMPSVETIRSWTCEQSIDFLLDYPPASGGAHISRPEFKSVRLFLRSTKDHGGRTGKQWSRGDWLLSLEELEKIGDYCKIGDVIAAVDACRKELDRVLLGLP